MKPTFYFFVNSTSTAKYTYHLKCSRNWICMNRNDDVIQQKVGHHCFFSPSFWSNIRIPWSAIELANWRSLWAFYWYYFRISVSHDSFNRSFHSIPVPFRLNDFNCKIHTRKMNKFECVHARGTRKPRSLWTNKFDCQNKYMEFASLPLKCKYLVVGNRLQ